MSPSLFVFSFAFVLAFFTACGPRTKYMNLLDNMGPSLRDEGLNARMLDAMGRDDVRDTEGMIGLKVKCGVGTG